MARFRPAPWPNAIRSGPNYAASRPSTTARTGATACPGLQRKGVPVLFAFVRQLAGAIHFLVHDARVVHGVIRGQFKYRGRRLAPLDIREPVNRFAESRIAASCHDDGLQLG